MDNLDEQILEYEKKLKELKDLKAQQPATILIHTFTESSGKIRISMDKKLDWFVDFLRRIPGRVYVDANRDNIIAALNLQEVLNFLEAHKDYAFTIKWEEGVKDRYEAWIKQPDVMFVLDEEKSRVKTKFGPKASSVYLYLNYEITSMSYGYTGRDYSFSVAEAYKVPGVMEKYHSGLRVEYDEKLKEIIKQQAEKNAALLTVANATDWPDLPNPFTGIDPNTGEQYNLKPVQRVAVKFAELTNDNCIIAYDMGGGKTNISIAITELRQYKKVLCIVPAKLKTNWARIIKDFTGKPARILSGESPDELAQADILLNRFQYYIINYDILSRASLEEENDKGDTIYENKWSILINVAKFSAIFVDECHRIKNMGSSRSKAVRSLQAPHFIPLSGTVIVNRPKELFPNLHLINKQDFANEAAFVAQFMNSDGTPKNLKKLHEVLSHYIIRRTSEQLYGKDLSANRIPFTKTLGEQARYNYGKVLEGVYTALRRPDYIRNVTSILAELTRCKQICSADNCETSVELAIEAREETGRKVIIFSQFIDSILEIKRQIGDKAVAIWGETPDEVRDEYTRKFQQRDNFEIEYFVTNILEGQTWTEGHTVIFNDLWWTDKDHAQAEGRCFGRTNDPHSGNSYWIRNENTIDEFIYSLIQQKRAMFKEVIDDVRNTQDSMGSVAMALVEHLRKNL